MTEEISTYRQAILQKVKEYIKLLTNDLAGG